ncbi:MAG: PorT family protein [Chlorobi bacterium]|nr:PorT family protein [Chlorobiota bacterium]
MRFLFLSFTFFIIHLFSTQNLIAQHKKFDAGIFFNINANTISRKDRSLMRSPAGKGFAGGMSVGASIKRMFSPHFQGGFELRYIKKGSLYNTAQGEGLLKLNYIEIPVLIGYSFFPDKVNIILESGFAVAKMFQSDKSINLLVGSAGTKNINEDFNDFDISWIGIFKWSMNPKAAKNVFLGFRFEHSILSIHELWNLYNINWGVQFEYVL